MRGLRPHECSTVAAEGWAGLEDKEILSLASGQFDVFITTDRNLAAQQNLARSSIAIVAIRARSNRLEDLLPLTSHLLAALPFARKRAVTTVDENMK
jgi:hypothetical protein